MTSAERLLKATEAWRLMSEFSMGQFKAKSGSLRELGLTPGHVKALLTFDPAESRSMGECAHEMGCDASTATWLIDRLEERGLVERRPSPTDRRVKEVVMTPRGNEVRARLQAHYSEPPEALLELDEDTLEGLIGILSGLGAPVTR